MSGLGTLNWRAADGGLVAAPVLATLSSWAHASTVRAAPIDPELADTAAFCEHYEVSLLDSANCVIVAGRRGELTSYAACMVLATTRADVNGLVRRRLEARKASFASMEDAVTLTGMEYGGIGPIGLPESWPILVDAAVAARAEVVIGSGLRRSKISLPGRLLGELPNAEVVPGLAS